MILLYGQKATTLFLFMAFLAMPLCALAEEHGQRTQATPPSGYVNPAQATTATQSNLITSKKDVYIAGKKVITKNNTADSVALQKLPDLPPELNTQAIQTSIQQRRHMQIYNHNPATGPLNAPVTIIEFTDLSCLQCYKVLKEVDTIREKYADKIRYISVHMPVDPYNTSNPAAFYGRLAQQSGIFWEYRKLLIELTDIQENTFSEKLIEAGIDVKRLRTLIRKNARQFYKELDADTILSQKTTESQPPAIYVNGIRVGISIPYSNLEDLIKYEIKEQEKIAK